MYWSAIFGHSVGLLPPPNIVNHFRSYIDSSNGNSAVKSESWSPAAPVSLCVSEFGNCKEIQMRNETKNCICSNELALK